MSTVSHAGRFITVEGIEGAGKTTIVAFLKDLLLHRGIDVVVTREPGGTPIAEAIRQLILQSFAEEKMDENAELLLYFASRAQHLAKIIRPALAAGKTVLCDRFTDASYAYQGGGRGIPESRIALLEDWVQRGLQPDVTILCDVPPEVGLQRIATRKLLDRFEVEKVPFFERVRAVYLERAKRYPERYRVINAAASLEAVKDDLEALEDFSI